MQYLYVYFSLGRLACNKSKKRREVVVGGAALEAQFHDRTADVESVTWLGPGDRFEVVLTSKKQFIKANRYGNTVLYAAVLSLARSKMHADMKRVHDRGHFILASDCDSLTVLKRRGSEIGLRIGIEHGAYKFEHRDEVLEYVSLGPRVTNILLGNQFSSARSSAFKVQSFALNMQWAQERLNTSLFYQMLKAAVEGCAKEVKIPQRRRYVDRKGGVKTRFSTFVWANKLAARGVILKTQDRGYVCLPFGFVHNT